MPALVDSVLAISRSAPEHRGAAVLRRMRLQPAADLDGSTAAEISGCYSRGERMHAIAARVEAATHRRRNTVAGGGPTHRLRRGAHTRG
ncbi:hypothetical protein [Mycobacterium tilburgii]|uniref:hypothetical protein n=1 Tax=Mycobacterium tilburgii TaxID=44467 RepID=UPI0021B41143|nr:hypothetical protein [Mycobacterium tilburgii]